MNSTLLKYLTLSIATIITNEILKKYLPIDELVNNYLSIRLTTEQINDYFKFQKKWEWTSYFVLPIIVLIKTLIVATVLYISLFFSNKDLKFNKIWDIVLKAEFIFLLVPAFKIIWFCFFQTSFTLEDIQNFYPLSALNIIGYENLENWFIYPFQILNLFELLYFLILAYYIGQITKTTTDKGLKIVACSYGSTLILWVATVMFLTLNYS
jgi:hypothetical protein